MDSSGKLLQIALLLLLCLSLSNARILPKLHGTAGVVEEESTCFESLFELQSCSSEIVLFFLNGETYLGPGCCRAIRTIQKDCWPNLLGSLGYSTEEGDILEGYCEDGTSPPSN